MEVNGRPHLKIEVAEQKLIYVSLSMSLGEAGGGAYGDTGVTEMD